MLISTEIASIARRVGDEKEALRLVAAAGFEAYDLSLFEMAKYDYGVGDVVDRGHPLAAPDSLDYVKSLKQLADDLGLVCNQSHAPFPVRCTAIREKLKAAIEATAVAGGKICIIHPDNALTAKENAVMYRELLPTAHDFGVKIAAENMWYWNKETDEARAAACSHHDDFVAHIEEVNDPYLVACLDIGHADMRGLGTSPREMIYALRDHLAAIHMHDNDRWHDSHEIPFSMQIDLADAVRALREVGYRGDMTLEADRYLANHPDLDPAEGVKNMADAARRLREMFLAEQ